MKKALSFFDVTNITIGSIIGADIYVASAISAGVLGPFSLVVWFIAGAMATVLALAFVLCSHYVPKVGGPFAYVSEAFNDFWGFIAGWSLWMAELIALPVFAIAFANYLHYLIPLTPVQEVMVKAAFLLALTAINVVGVKAAGIANDVLTILKLSPLLLLVVVGLAFLAMHPDTLRQNYSPFIPFGVGQFHTSLVLIFWAYVGFELTTIPASEVREPGRTIPRAIVTGMIIVTLFYISTNFVVYGIVNWQELSHTSVPLALAGAALLGSAGTLIMSIGALISVSGSDESDMLASARLAYAMSVDGLLPKALSRIHPRFKTPHNALIIQGVAAFALSIYSDIPKLISFSVFNLAFAFLLTCLALIVIQRRKGVTRMRQRAVPLVGIAICIYLLYSTSVLDKLMGSAVLASGAIVYVRFSPKVDIQDLKDFMASEAQMLERSMAREGRFLGQFVRLLHRMYVKGAANGKAKR